MKSPSLCAHLHPLSERKPENSCYSTRFLSRRIHYKNKIDGTLSNPCKWESGFYNKKKNAKDFPTGRVYQSIFESVGSGRSITYDAHELLYVGVTAGLDRQIHGSLTKLGQSTDDYDVLYRKASYHKFMFRKKLHVQKANRSSVLSTGAGASFAL